MQFFKLIHVLIPDAAELSILFGSDFAYPFRYNQRIPLQFLSLHIEHKFMVALLVRFYATGTHLSLFKEQYHTVNSFII
jgi:hypothetical protein